MGAPRIEQVLDILRSEGLTKEILLGAVEVGEAHRKMATLHDPPNAAGYDAWRWATRSLRDRLCPLPAAANGKQWTYDNSGNFCRVVSPSGVKIAVMSGDRNTGTDKTPRTAYRRGPRISEDIHQNGQLALPGVISSEAPRITNGQDGTITAVLLVHCDHRKGEVRSELSVPVGLDKKNHASAWLDRWRLPAIDLDDASVDNDDPEGEDTGEIDIPILRG